jgi:hypothetical protein
MRIRRYGKTIGEATAGGAAQVGCVLTQLRRTLALRPCASAGSHLDPALPAIAPIQDLMCPIVIQGQHQFQPTS